MRQGTVFHDRGQVLALSVLFIAAVLVVLLVGGIALGATSNGKAQTQTAVDAGVAAAVAQATPQTVVAVNIQYVDCYDYTDWSGDTDGEYNGLRDHDGDDDNPSFQYTCDDTGGTTLTLGPFDATTVAAIERAAQCVLSVPGGETGNFTQCTGWRQDGPLTWRYPHEGAATIAAQGSFDQNIPTGAQSTVLSFTLAPNRGPSGRVMMKARVVYPGIRTPWGTEVSAVATASAAPHLPPGVSAVAKFPG